MKFVCRLFAPITGILLVVACSTSPQVTTTQELAHSADGPYSTVFVVTLFSKFDNRHYLEDEIVKALAKHNVRAIAATSHMDSRTPVTVEFITEMMAEVGADALLFTRLADLQSSGEVVDMSPESTYNVYPTYYFNVFEVELTEYLEPQNIEFTHRLSTTSDLYSFARREKVWSITTDYTVKGNEDHMRDYSIYVDEANAIVSQMVRDGVVTR